jgi:hypothetical protein
MTGVRTTLTVVLVFEALASGCTASCSCNGDEPDGAIPDASGDADADVDADGDRDADADADADPDGDRDDDATLSFDYLVLERTPEGRAGDPIEGGAIAVDTPAGRAEYQTDANGLARIEVARDAAWFTFTIARAGYGVVSLFHATGEDLEFWLEPEGRIETLLEPLVEPAEPDVVEITVTAAGVPAGATWCVSASPFEITCGDALADATFLRERTEDPVRVIGFVIDLSGAFANLVEDELPDGQTDSSIELDFAAAGPATPTSIALTIELPADPESVLRTQGVVTDLLLPVFAMEPATYLVRGGSTGHAIAGDGASIAMDLSWFQPEGSQPIFGFALYPDDSYGAYAYRWFSTALAAGVYDVIDIPRISSPSEAPTLGSTFTWQRIAGVDRYAVLITSAAGEQVLWTALTDHEVTLTLPELPSTYDPTDDWPVDGRGGFRVFAWQAPFAVPDPTDPLMIDQQESASLWYELSLER